MNWRQLLGGRALWTAIEAGPDVLNAMSAVRDAAGRLARVPDGARDASEPGGELIAALVELDRLAAGGWLVLRLLAETGVIPRTPLERAGRAFPRSPNRRG